MEETQSSGSTRMLSRQSGGDPRPKTFDCEEMRRLEQDGTRLADVPGGSRTMNRRGLVGGAALMAAAATANQLLGASSAHAGAVKQVLEPVPAMRTPHDRTQAGRTGTSPDLPPVAIIALNRMAFGPRPGDIEDFNALGSDDAERLQTYVDQQLDPDSIDDSEFEAIAATFEFETLHKSRNQLWQDHEVQRDVDWQYRRLPAWETERMAFVRALHSKKQLVEVLADFWHNHFNVYAWEGWPRSTWVHYDRDVIRGNMLGNYRQMLGEVAKSPAMLYYLDNRLNEGGNPNENYARELFELHALGAENYMGVVSTISESGLYDHPAPKDEDDWPLLYVDDDVYGATTCFTGWKVDTDTGAFKFDASRHFPYQKLMLGRMIPPQQGIKDGETVLDVLANHHGTATFICRKLCRRLIGDRPLERIVQKAAQVFYDNRTADDQLKKVVRTVLLSEEFRTTWGEKIKRPFEVAASVMRATQCNFDARSDWFFWVYNPMGQPLFGWHPPDGYPDQRTDWSSTMPMLQRWRFVNSVLGWKIGGEGDDKDDLRIQLDGITPAGVQTPLELVDFWSERLIGYRLPASERQHVAEFVAQGRGIDSDLRPDQVDERLRYMIGLILMSPSFQWR